MTKETLKGLSLAIVAGLSFSLVYIFSKNALNQIHLAQFGVYWFSIALIENLLYVFKAGLKKQYLALDKRKKAILWLIGLIELIGTGLFFYAIDLFENPAVMSFLFNITPILVGILSFVFLHERFSWLELIGIVITLAGAFVISYQGSIVEDNDKYLLGVAVAFASALFLATNSVIIRKNVRTIHPAMMGVVRAIYLLSFSVFMMFKLGLSWKIPTNALWNIIAGATLGPFIGVLATLASLKYIEATINSVIINAKGIFVLALVYYVFGLVPKEYQITGGLLTIAGVIILSFGKHLKEKR